jgi:hypothetical protein
MSLNEEIAMSINPAQCGENVGGWAFKMVPNLFARTDVREMMSEFLGGVVKAMLRMDPGLDPVEISHVECALYCRAKGLPRSATAADRHNHIITGGG